MKLIPMETFCCCCKLETGGLIMGILATITSVGFFISSLFSYSESMDNIRDHFLLTDLLKDGPDHVVHIVFITMTAIDVGSSVLLLVGVLKRKRWLLVPWIVCTIVNLIVFCAEIFTFVVLSFVISGTICFIIYIWYSVVLLYAKYEQEEMMTNNVVMADVSDDRSTNLPYANFNNVNEK